MTSFQENGFKHAVVDDLNSNGNNMDYASDDDDIMLFPITDLDVDASCESLADKKSAPEPPRKRSDSDGQYSQPFITLRERRLLKVNFKKKLCKDIMYNIKSNF